jgi:hypothetical protein
MSLGRALLGGAELKLTLDLLAAHNNMLAPVEELRRIGQTIEAIKSQECTYEIARGLYGSVYNICSQTPCDRCVALKVSISRSDISKGEFVIQNKLFKAFRDQTYDSYGFKFNLEELVPAPLAYIRYIPYDVAGGDSRSRQRTSDQVVRGQPLQPQGIGLDVPFQGIGLDVLIPMVPTLDVPLPQQPVYRHAMISSVLQGTTAYSVLRNPTVTSDQFLNVVRRVLVFISEAVLRVPGFQHNDLHLKNIKVNGDVVSVLDFGMANSEKVRQMFHMYQVLLNPLGNWDCWKFMAHVLGCLLDHAIRGRRAWALPIIKSIRDFLDDDIGLCYLVRDTEINDTRVRMTLAWGGRPFKYAGRLRGSDTYFMPVYRDIEGRLRVLPGFPTYQARYPASKFVEYFLSDRDDGSRSTETLVEGDEV